MPPKSPLFQQSLRQWMRRHHWKTKDLAQYLGVSRQTLYHWIEGKSLPKNQEVLCKLYLLGGASLITLPPSLEETCEKLYKSHHYFEIEGGYTLKGSINIPGAKNAALPMLCASLLTDEPCTFTNVPNIRDIQSLLHIFREIGVDVSYQPSKKRVTIQAKKVDLEKLATLDAVKKFRASILMFGPLLSRFGYCRIKQPGGCVLGARPNFIHTEGLSFFGAEISENETFLTGKLSPTAPLKQHQLLLSEASVTGTENLAMFLARKAEPAEIFFTASEPHVVALLKMLQRMGARIKGIGSHHLKIQGTPKLKGGTFRIPSDGLLAGTYAIAGILTRGSLDIYPVNHAELFSFYGVLKRMGATFSMKGNHLLISPSPKPLQAIPKVQTAIFPGFPTDLQSPLGVLLTQCEGKTLLFETLFENRFTYLAELEKMGAKVQILNPHQARIHGPTPLKGTEVQSWDLRAGAAMVLAGLIAKGKTHVTNIQYIDRGYENLEGTLASLGARIKRLYH